MAKIENIFRKIEPVLWGDEKFMALSPLAPSGQALWLYLLTAPQTLSIPGVLRVGPLGLSEELRWPQDALARAMEEILAQGLAKADYLNRIIWIPKAINRTPPSNQGRIITWARDWRLLPPCDLRTEIGAAIAELVADNPALSRTWSLRGIEAALPVGPPNSVTNIPDLVLDVDVDEEGQIGGERSWWGPPPHPFALFDLWNSFVEQYGKKLARATKLTEKRKRWCKARLEKHPEREFWEQMLTLIYRSPFCLGDNDRKWRAHFDWLVRDEEALTKLQEGRYAFGLVAGRVDPTSTPPKQKPVPAEHKPFQKHVYDY
jgi:hypothetical protein